jgi:hypothetical protein
MASLPLPSAPGHDAVIRAWLERSSPMVLAVYALCASFGTYFCMYAYRKPFAVGSYAGTFEVLGVTLQTKIAFIIAQVVGYTASKFLGIRVVSEMTAARRARAIALAIVIAEAALGLFAIAPPGLDALCLFINGLALGVVWGLVFAFLEGRTTSDVLGAGLSVSFIVASGFVKTAGKVVLDWGVGERAMPAFVGLLFALPILLFIALLAQLPPPTGEDEAARLHRQPMSASARREFFISWAPGLLMLVLGYALLSAYRDFRDNFARELWDALGYTEVPAILTTAELPVAFGALLAVGSVIAIRNNQRALLAIHGLLVLGALLIGGSTVLFQLGLLGPAPWMISVGLGLYVAYVPFNCVLFDRMLPALGTVGTAGFMIYVADSLGYLGSTSVLLFKNFVQPQLPWLEFMTRFSLLTAVICAASFAGSLLYFGQRATRAL